MGLSRSFQLLVTLERQPRLEDCGRACRPQGGTWALAEDSRQWQRWGGHGWILDPERVPSLQLEDGMGEVVSQQGGRHAAWRPAGPPWTLMWFVPCTEHLTKGEGGWNSPPATPWLRAVGSAHSEEATFSISYKGPLWDHGGPQPGNFTDVGLNPSLSS